MLLSAASFGCSASLARAAQLTEDYTLFYYLIEMQRRYKRECAGTPMPGAPSLTPSEPLRKLAQDSISSGIPLDSLAAANLAGVAFQTLSVPGRTPQQAFDALYAGQCPSLMKPEYRYIGAASTGDRWLLLLAAAEPGSVPAPQNGAARGFPGAPASPLVLYELEPEHRGRAGLPPAHVPVVPDVPYSPVLPPSGAGFVSVPATPVVPAAPVIPATPAAPAAPVVSGVSSGPDLPPGGPASEPVAPAEPVILYEMEVDHRGQVRFPTGAAPAGPGASSGPDLPPGGAGPVADPAAPAAPIITREYEIDASGRLVEPSFSGAPRREGVLPTVPQANPSGGVVPPAPVFSPGRVSGPETPQARPGVVPLSDERPMPPLGTPVTPPSPSFSAAPPPGAPAAAPGAVGSADAGALPALINEWRASGPVCGGERLPVAGPLRFSPQLAAAAREHVADMAARGYFSGTSPEGLTLGKRVSGAGYMWGLVAGNIASLRGGEAQVLGQWTSRDEQCRNLAGAEFQDMGAARDAASGLWSVIFAAPLEVAGERPER